MYSSYTLATPISLKRYTHIHIYMYLKENLECYLHVYSKMLCILKLYTKNFYTTLCNTFIYLQKKVKIINYMLLWDQVAPILKRQILWNSNIYSILVVIEIKSWN